MADVSREEFDYRQSELKEDINQLGNSMRSALAEHKKEVRDNFKDVWKGIEKTRDSIDKMIFKVAAVVTVCSTIVLLIFKLFESNPATRSENHEIHFKERSFNHETDRRNFGGVRQKSN